MTKIFTLIASAAVASIIVGNTISSNAGIATNAFVPVAPELTTAEQESKAITLESGAVIVPIPRPRNNPEYCPRNEIPGTASSHVTDAVAVQHCVEKDCGLGVYSQHKEDSVERCSYCGAVKPSDL